MSRRTLIAGAFAVFMAVVVLASWPVFLMPYWLYQALYGWRYPQARACGDVVLHDAGPGAVAERYRLDFGTVALDEAVEKEFTLCRLPREWMTVGLEIRLPGIDRNYVEIEALQQGPLRRVNVTATVRTDDGHLVTSASGRLGTEWTWSYSGNDPTSFVYPSGLLFAPIWRESYVLEFSVVPGVASSGVSADLLMTGGGWKTSTPPFRL